MRSVHLKLTNNSDGHDSNPDMAPQLGDILRYFGHRRDSRETYRFTQELFNVG
jgi:secreted PhoX family phosphatase